MIRSAGWMLESMFLRLNVTIDVTCVLARASETRHSAAAIVRESRAVRGEPSTPVSSSGSQSVSSRLRSRNRTGRPQRLAVVAEPLEAGRRVAGPFGHGDLARAGGEHGVERGREGVGVRRGELDAVADEVRLDQDVGRDAVAEVVGAISARASATAPRRLVPRTTATFTV